MYESGALEILPEIGIWLSRAPLSRVAHPEFPGHTVGKRTAGVGVDLTLVQLVDEPCSFLFTCDCFWATVAC